jgi:hypothetical protein
LEAAANVVRPICTRVEIIFMQASVDNSSDTSALLRRSFVFPTSPWYSPAEWGRQSSFL